MTGLLGLTILSAFVTGLSAQPITYDQRQEGRVNVQVDVKDVQILAIVDSDMLDDFNYDYAYDYSDFTVKPSPRPTTAKPSSTSKSTPTKPSSEAFTTSTLEVSSSSTVLDSSTIKTAEEPLIKDNSTSSSDNSTVKIAESSTSNATKQEQDNSTTELSATSASTASAEVSSKRPVIGIAEPRKRCPTGFQMRSGRCFKRRLALISPRLALMKLAPAILAKSQLLTSATS